MAFKLGSTDINKVYLGSTEINSIYLGSTEVYSGVSFDADAQAYFTAASITDSTEQNAVNQLVLDLKGGAGCLTPNSTDLWTNAVAHYPVSPTSLSAAQYNLRNPTQYTIAYQNSPTHSSQGVTFDGISQYADTNLALTSTITSYTDIAMGFYGQPYEIQQAAPIFHGVISTNQWRHRYNSSNQFFWDGGNTSTGRLTAGVLTPKSGFWLTTNTTSGQEIWKDGSSVASDSTNGGGLPVSAYNTYIAAFNNNGAIAGITDLIFKYFVVLNFGITTNAAADLYDAVQRYQTNVISGGRQL